MNLDRGKLRSKRQASSFELIQDLLVFAPQGHAAGVDTCTNVTVWVLDKVWLYVNAVPQSA
jgi:hypothetical protein